jgi:hypothetical protein
LAHAELFSIDVLAVSAIGLRMVAAANLVEVAALAGVAKLCRERRHQPSSAAQSIARNSVSLKSA